RPEQEIKESRRRDLAGHLDHVDGEAPFKQRPVRQDVAGCSGGVARDDQPLANESLRKDARQYGEEVKQASHSGDATRGCFVHDAEVRRSECEGSLAFQSRLASKGRTRTWSTILDALLHPRS